MGNACSNLVNCYDKNDSSGLQDPRDSLKCTPVTDPSRKRIISSRNELSLSDQNKGIRETSYSKAETHHRNSGSV